MFGAFGGLARRGGWFEGAGGSHGEAERFGDRAPGILGDSWYRWGPRDGALSPVWAAESRLSAAPEQGSGRHLKAGLAFGCPLAPRPRRGSLSAAGAPRRARCTHFPHEVVRASRERNVRGTVPRLARAQGGPGGSAGESGGPGLPPPAARAGAANREAGSGPTAARLPRAAGLPADGWSRSTSTVPGAAHHGEAPGERSGAVAREDGLAEEMGYFLLVSFAAFFFKREPHAPPADR